LKKNIDKKTVPIGDSIGNAKRKINMRKVLRTHVWNY